MNNFENILFVYGNLKKESDKQFLNNFVFDEEKKLPYMFICGFLPYIINNDFYNVTNKILKSMGISEEYLNFYKKESGWIIDTRTEQRFHSWMYFNNENYLSYNEE